MTTSIKHRLLILFTVLIAFFALTGCQSDENKAMDYLASAQEYFDKGEYALSSVELKNAIRKDSNLVSAYMLQAKIFEKNRNRESMHAFLATVLQLEPEHIEANLEIAKLYAQARNIPIAQKYLDVAIKANADEFDQHLIQGFIFQFGERLGEAREEARSAITLRPDSISANHLLASILMQEKNYSQALLITDNTLKTHPDAESILLLSSKIHTLMGDFSQAAVPARRLTQDHPSTLRYHYLLSALLDQSGDSEAAEQALREATKLNPENQRAKIALAGYISKQSKNQRAIELLSSYVDSDPERASEELKLILAELYQQEGNINQATTIYLELSKVSNKYAAIAKNKLALLALKGNRRQDALKILNEVLSADFNNIEALTSRAVIYLWDRDTDKAITDLLNAVREDQKSELALKLLAQAYQQSGDTKLAALTLKKLLKVNPKNKSALLLYSQLQTKNNQFGSAISVLQDFINSNPSSASAKNELLNTYLAAKKWPEAKNLASEIAKSSNQPEFNKLINAKIFQLNGQFDKSIASFKELIDTKIYISSSLKGLIFSYRKQEKSTEGIKYLIHFSNNNPDDLFVKELLVNEYNKNQQYNAANKLLAITLKSNPNWAKGHLLLAKIYAIQGNFKQAILSGLQSLESSNQPASIDLLLLLASSYEKEGNSSEAIIYYQKALARSPNINAAANNLALLLAGDGSDKQRLRKALKIAKRFEQSNEAIYIDTLGWIYFLRNDLPPAKELFLKATRSEPNNPIFNYHLGATYFKLFEFSKAKKYLEKSHQLAEDHKKFNGYDEVVEMLGKMS